MDWAKPSADLVRLIYKKVADISNFLYFGANNSKCFSEWETRDWAELNPDVLRLISKKLGDISNVVRIRAVCKNWRLTIGPCDCPPQLPWYIEYPHTNLPNYKFFSLYSNKTRTLHVPLVAKGKAMYDPFNRLFFMHDDQNLLTLFFNPLTRSHVSISHIESLIPYHPVYIGLVDNLNHNPSENGDIVALFFDKTKRNMFPPFVVVCRFGDTQLAKIIDVPHWDSICYSQGRLFVSVVKTAETRVFDVTTGDEVLVVSSPRMRFDYLIDACGYMLGVVIKSMEGEEWQFEVYRLEDDGTNSHWVKMTSGIGDRMLFLNVSRPSRGLCGLCLKAGDFEGFKGNCIYFFRQNCKLGFVTLSGEYVLACYDLKTKKTQKVVPCCVQGEGRWFVPSLS